MSSLNEHQGHSKTPSPRNASLEPSFEHSAHQGSLHSHSPLPVTAIDVLRGISHDARARRRIILLEAELRGSKQDIAQLERDITRLTKDLRSQRNQIIVLERGKDDFRETITILLTKNKKLRQQGQGSARVRDLETQVGAFTADRKKVEEGIMTNVSVDMDTMIEAVHDLKARICDAVKAQFAVGVGQFAGNVEGDAQGRLEQDIEMIDKSDHTRTTAGPGSVAENEQLAVGTYRKPPELVSEPKPQQEDTLDHGAFRVRPDDAFSKALDDELHRSLTPSPSCDLVFPSMEPEDPFEAAMEAATRNMSDSESSITTALVTRAKKSLAGKPHGSEKTESLRLGSSTPEDHVILGLTSRKPVGLLRNPTKPGSPMSPTTRELVTSGKWSLSTNPKGSSNNYGRLRVYPEEQDNFPWIKRRRTAR